MRLALFAILIPGCAALTDPAHHGTAYMRARWAKAEPCVRFCEFAFPNQMTEALISNVSGVCFCRTSPVNMGASYYEGDHAPRGAEQTASMSMRIEDVMRDIEKAAQEIASTPCR